MQRPSHPGIDVIEAILTDIAEMEEAVRALKHRLNELPAQFAPDLPNVVDRAALAQYLYWMVPEVSARAISEGLLGIPVHQLKHLIENATGTIVCDRCKQPIEFRCRTHMQESLQKLRLGRTLWAEGYSVVCDPCRKELHDLRNEQARRQEYQRQQRLHVLRTMPYRDYLLTPEWQERRRCHLKSAGYRCQVCNAGGVCLNVHHRTYERRGEELFKDLITLCETCHDLFHREGRLATE